MACSVLLIAALLASRSVCGPVQWILNIWNTKHFRSTRSKVQGLPCYQVPRSLHLFVSCLSHVEPFPCLSASELKLS
ncbi:hypothetical protein BDP55DRAFT_671399 [Colletotrichum godetiae]|uniref:Secreted protein n=1 Tax=Colletotrichum godetiae TaxID=1209918 RepID=A0AAJ0AFF5_9PEZI|nr:uncharacterized protein BDP55DRAFT_671399 [Colletotrichum godetiae]KAK1672918.1 hypothetical protein BDP55DRAFT_671399 [Colletotrichum godetiae]